MAIFAFVGNKGGSGKTTLAMNVAAGLSGRESTVVLDADPQGSSLQWNAFMNDDRDLQVVDASTGVAATLADLPDYRHIVIDCPPSAHADQTREALAASDVALIPVQPSPVDIWATVHIAGVIAEVQQANPRLSPMLVINQVETRTTLSKLVRDALVELELPVANTSLRRRMIYRTSALEGKSVLDVGKRGAAAADELNQLIDEILPNGHH